MHTLQGQKRLTVVFLPEFAITVLLQEIQEEYMLTNLNARNSQAAFSMTETAGRATNE